MHDNSTFSTSIHKGKKKKKKPHSNECRKVLTGKQKKELCQTENDPTLTQHDLARIFGGIGRSTVAEILAQSHRWLALKSIACPSAIRTSSHFNCVSLT